MLLTGQVIDIASEVFEVDAAGGDEDMLVDYSGVIGIVSSVAGSLLGSPLGAWMANWSIPIALAFSAITSFGACATRFAMRADITASMTSPEKTSEKIAIPIHTFPTRQRIQIRIPTRIQIQSIRRHRLLPLLHLLSRRELVWDCF